MRAGSKRKIWIDLDNSPHVPFFAPIIKELDQMGHPVLLTARDCFQVCALGDYYKLDYKRIGRHYGANKLLKVIGTLWRSLQLATVIIREKPDVAVSHGSRPLILLSAALRIPTILLFDYEHTASLPFIRPTLGIAPEVISTPRIAKQFKFGLRTYAGLKEDVYVASYRPDSSVLRQLDLSPEDIVATIRPPATEAHYHNRESEKLYIEVVEFLGRTPAVRMVILPRNEATQREFVYHTWPKWCKEKKIIVPGQVVNGLDLIWCSDFVISGGGTINREAAALGVPAYSIFRGAIGAVDRDLADMGRVVLIQSVDEVREKILPIRRVKRKDPNVGERMALKQIMAAIEELAQNGVVEA